MKLDIIFRSCSKSGQTRYIDAPKSEISLVCFNSVIDSAGNALGANPDLELRLHVLDDHSEPAFVEQAKQMLAATSISGAFIAMQESGQSASMRFACEYARDNCLELIYFVEDDYLHAPSAISEILDAHTEFSAKTGSHVVISPCDHATEYRAPDINTRPLSRVVVGKNRHWKTVFGTTSTYLIDRWTLDTYWDLYIKHSTYAPENDICEDNTINLIYRKIPCFSPIPSLTAHIGPPGLEPPFFDYRAQWERYKLPH